MSRQNRRPINEFPRNETVPGADASGTRVRFENIVPPLTNYPELEESSGEKLDENKMLDEFGPGTGNYERGPLGFMEIPMKRRRDECWYNIRYDFREAGMSGESSHGRGTRGEQHPEINVRLGSGLSEHRQESFLCSGERGKQHGLANTCTGRRSGRSAASKTRFSLLAGNLCNLYRSIKAIARTIGNICGERLSRERSADNRPLLCKNGRGRWTLAPRGTDISEENCF